MHVAWTIVIGFAVGMLTTVALAGRARGGVFIGVAIGILGALIAAYGGEAIGIYDGGEYEGYVGAFVGALVLVLLYRRFVRND